MFATWFRVRPACRECHLRLDRGEHDYFIGGYTINLVVAELIAVALILGFMIWTWPAVPWTGVMWGTAVLMLGVPFATYPYSKALWLAIDLAFRPPELDDFAPASDP